MELVGICLGQEALGAGEDKHLQIQCVCQKPDTLEWWRGSSRAALASFVFSILQDPALKCHLFRGLPSPPYWKDSVHFLLICLSKTVTWSWGWSLAVPVPFPQLSLISYSKPGALAVFLPSHAKSVFGELASGARAHFDIYPSDIWPW